MLELILEKQNEYEAIFAYYPEKEDKCGKIKINKSSGKIDVIEISENDELHNYMHHAVSRVLEYYQEKKYEKSVIVAWY